MKKINALILSICLSMPLLASGTDQVREPLPDFLTEYAKEVAKEISPAILERAENGDPVAMAQLGYSYEVQGNPEESFKWYKKASDAGFHLGQYSVGMFYFHGKVVSQNLKIACDLIKRAALQGLAPAEYQYGYFLFRGIGCKSSESEGIKWMKKAADKDYYPAKGALGEIYWKGWSVKPDILYARKLLEEGAEAGDPFSQGNLGEFLLSEAKTEKDRQLGMNWLWMATEKEDPKAMFILATELYKIGSNTSATKLMYRSTLLGNADAQVLVGTSLLMAGRNGETSYKNARILLMKAAVQNHPVAMFHLGNIYKDGLGVLKNQQTAKKWYKKSCEAGFKDACYMQ